MVEKTLFWGFTFDMEAFTDLHVLRSSGPEYRGALTTLINSDAWTDICFCILVYLDCTKYNENYVSFMSCLKTCYQRIMA